MPICSTPTAVATSTTCSRGAPLFSGMPIRSSSKRCNAWPRRARPTARRHAARWSSRKRCVRASPDREAAAGLVGHRSRDDGSAPGTRCDRSRQDRQVRRLLPRPPRRVARRGRQRSGHARLAGIGGGHAGSDGRHDRRALQRLGCARHGHRDPRLRARGGSRRAGRGQHGSRRTRGRLSRGAARALRHGGCAPRVRRGHHRFPLGNGRRAGTLRRAARPLDLRKGHRRRPPARGAGRIGGAHGRARAARRVYQAGTLSGNPLATAAGIAVLSLLDEAAYEALETNARRLESTLRDACAAGAVDAQVTRVATLVGLFFATARVVDYEGARPPITSATRGSSTGSSTAACSSRRAATRRCSYPSRTTTPPPPRPSRQ